MIKKKETTSKPLPVRQDGTSAPKQRLGTVREACSYGRFSHTRLYDLIAAKKIDAYKDGARTKIDLDSIDRMHAKLPKLELKREGA